MAKAHINQSINPPTLISYIHRFSHMFMVKIPFNYYNHQPTEVKTTISPPFSSQGTATGVGAEGLATWATVASITATWEGPRIKTVVQGG